MLVLAIPKLMIVFHSSSAFLGTFLVFNLVMGLAFGPPSRSALRNTQPKNCIPSSGETLLH